MEWKKGLVAGIIAGILIIILEFLLMAIPGYTEWFIETFPQMMTPLSMITGPASSFIMGIIMGLIYAMINRSIPGKGLMKGINYGIMVWLLADIMWPIMMMSFAPVYMWITELVSGLIFYSIVGAVISFIYGKL
jgi:hypothetical protein